LSSHLAEDATTLDDRRTPAFVASPRAGRTVIVTRGLKRNYDMGGEIIRRCAASILPVRRNEYVAIMGPSGSGQSYADEHDRCLDKRNAGEYWLNGTLVWVRR